MKGKSITFALLCFLLTHDAYCVGVRTIHSIAVLVWYIHDCIEISVKHNIKHIQHAVVALF